MARVEWSRLAPEDVELVVAILLCREYPSATRVRPSLGDGGIDVLVPVTGGYDVYQVKYFSQALTSGQKRQVVNSLRRIVEYAPQHGLVLKEWHLTVPLDPTNENREWLAKAATGTSLAADWRGLAFIEGLAAKYADVIDYYLRDGKDRLQAALSELTGVMKLTSQASDDTDHTLRPPDMTNSLAMLHSALNRHDPHYRYDFAVTGRELTVNEQEPGLVGTVWQQVGDSFVAWRIYARFDEAVYERPITVSVNIRAEPGTQLAQALEEYATYGVPFEAPAGAVSGSANLPGGFGGTLDGASLWFGDSVENPRYELRVQVLDAHDGELEAVRMSMMRTRGPSGRGVRGLGTETQGIVGLELRDQTESDDMSFTFRINFDNATGKRPEEILPIARFLDSLHTPNRLCLAPPYGAAMQNCTELRVEPSQNWRFIRHFIEALVAVQEEAPGTDIRVPELANVKVDEAMEWIHAARLISGETVEFEWNGLTLNGTGRAFDQLKEASGHAFRKTSPLKLSLGNEEFVLGEEEVTLESAGLEVDSLRPATDEYGRIRLVPVLSRVARRRLVSRSAESVSENRAVR